MQNQLKPAIIEAPSNLGLKPSGVEQLPQALLELGLAEGLGAQSARKLGVPSFSWKKDPRTGVRNAASIRAWSPLLANAIEAELDRGNFPLILGGDCSILLGSMLALRRRGRFGLLYLDGHADFFQPDADPEGEAASMDLALATGHGPAELTEMEGYFPLVRPEDVVAFGFRDHSDQAEHGSQPLPPKMLALDLPTIDALGIEATTNLALIHLQKTELAGFFIHFDADCLADDVMPAVDYRIEGGLSVDQVSHILKAAIATGRAVGLELTIYNPELDPERAAGRILYSLLTDIFGGRRQA